MCKHPLNSKLGKYHLTMTHFPLKSVLINVKLDKNKGNPTSSQIIPQFKISKLPTTLLPIPLLPIPLVPGPFPPCGGFMTWPIISLTLLRGKGSVYPTLQCGAV